MPTVMPTSIFTHFAAMVVLPILERPSCLLGMQMLLVPLQYVLCIASTLGMLSRPVCYWHCPPLPFPLLLPLPLPLSLSRSFSLPRSLTSLYLGSRDARRNFRDVQGLKLGSLQNLLHGRAWVSSCVKAY
ncbi:hypothetical protein F4825DRAFT_113094 [Nemania diffusa]|nr:hypothetical protein F4825DRAFT_113094 [Nemania diffusa]